MPNKNYKNSFDITKINQDTVILSCNCWKIVKKVSEKFTRLMAEKLKKKIRLQKMGIVKKIK